MSETMSGPPVAQDWQQWQQNPTLLPPSAMQTYDDANQTATPFWETRAGKALLATKNAYDSLAGPATSHGAPIAPPAPPLAPPAPPAAPPVVDAPRQVSPASYAAPAAPAAPMPPPVAPPPPQAPPTPLQAAPEAPVSAPSATQSPDLSGLAGGLNIQRNNPLNIRDGAGGFATYQSPAAGFDAARTLMASYKTQHGIDTLSGLISRWAPPTENDTASYIKTVSAATGIAPDAKIDLTDPATVDKIMPAMAKVESGTGGGGGGMIQAAPSMPPAPLPEATGSAGPGQSQDLASLIRNLQGAMPYSTAETQLPRGTPLLALASGLLSSRQFGEGLGKGISNMNAVTAADIANKRASNAQVLQLAQLGLLNNYRMGQLGLAGQRVAQGDHRVVQGDIRLGQTAARTDAYVTNAGNRYNVPLQAELSGARTAATAGAKDTAADIDQMVDAGQNAVIKGQQLAALQESLPTAGAGQGILGFKRAVSNYFNVPIGDTNPASSQLAQALASQTRGGGFMGKNMRTQREFNTIMEGLPSLDQHPEALPKMVSALQKLNAFNGQLYQEWNSMPESQKAQMRQNPDTYQSWIGGKLANFDKQTTQSGGLYAAPNASAPSQPAAKAPITGSYGGISYSFTPGQ